MSSRAQWRGVRPTGRLVRRISLAAAMMAALAVAGCSSGGGAAGGGGGGTIKIGATLPETGIYSAFGKYFVDAYKLWVDQTNAKGGLLGKKIDFTLYDDKSDAATAVRLYQKLITVDRADLLLGGFPTPVVAPVLQIVNRNQKVLTQGGVNAEPLIRKANYDWIFTTITGSSTWADPFLDWLKSVPAGKRPKKAAIIQEVNPFMQDVVANSLPKLKSMGIDVAYNETFSQDTQDFTSMIQKFKSAGVDFVFVAPNLPAGQSFLRTMAEQQYKPKLAYLVVGPTLPSWIKDLGSRTDKVFTSTPYWHSINTDDNAAFVKAIKDRYGYVPTRESGMAYTSLQVLEQAINATKSLDQQKLRDYIQTHQFETVSGPMRFDDAGLTNSPTRLMQVQGDAGYLVWPPDVKERDAQYTP